MRSAPVSWTRPGAIRVARSAFSVMLFFPASLFSVGG